MSGAQVALFNSVENMNGIINKADDKKTISFLRVRSSKGDHIMFSFESSEKLITFCSDHNIEIIYL